MLTHEDVSVQLSSPRSAPDHEVDHAFKQDFTKNFLFPVMDQVSSAKKPITYSMILALDRHIRDNVRFSLVCPRIYPTFGRIAAPTTSA